MVPESVVPWIGQQSHRSLEEDDDHDDHDDGTDGDDGDDGDDGNDGDDGDDGDGQQLGRKNSCSLLQVD